MLLGSRAFCFQLFTYFLEKIVALCSIMEFQWNQIFAIKNWHYIKPFIEKSIKIKNFYFHQLYPGRFFIVSKLYAILEYDLIKCTMCTEHTLDRHLEEASLKKCAYKTQSLRLLWGKMVHNQLNSGSSGLTNLKVLLCHRPVQSFTCRCAS